MKNLKLNSRVTAVFLTVAIVFSATPLSVFAVEKTDLQVLNNEVDKNIDLPNVVTKGKDKFRSDRILVKFKDDKKFKIVNLKSDENVETALQNYKKLSNVVYAEPDYIAFADTVPNDPYYSPYQWHLDNSANSGINTEEAWNISIGSGVVVAVIDTGVAYETASRLGRNYYQAPDLANTCFVQGYDFINADAYPNDDQGHGTHVAGTIAQSTNNNIGVAGVAYGSCIMPIKALDANGSGSYSAIADSIHYAVDNGAIVINMSLGGTADSSALRDAVAYAYNQGVTVVAAAGNDNSSDPHYPSSYNDYVISVGATDYTKSRAPYSNYGPDVDVVAPGGDTGEDANGDGYVDGILQNTFSNTLNNFGYYFYQGTSMASPHVAGVAALLISSGKATTSNTVRQALESTAQDLGVAGRDDQFGYGLVDAFASLSSSSTNPSTTTPPVENVPAEVVITSVSAVNTRVNGGYDIRVSAKNNEVVTEAVTYDIDVLAPNGSAVTWSGLGDKIANVPSGATLSQRWQGKVPRNAVKGTYTIQAKLVVKGMVTSTSTKTFIVK